MAAAQADDLIEPSTSELDSFADRRSTGKGESRSSLVQHDDLDRTCAILPGERSSGDEIDPERPEVIIRDVIETSLALGVPARHCDGDTGVTS